MGLVHRLLEMLLYGRSELIPGSSSNRLDEIVATELSDAFCPQQGEQQIVFDTIVQRAPFCFNKPDVAFENRQPAPECQGRVPSM